MNQQLTPAAAPTASEAIENRVTLYLLWFVSIVGAVSLFANFSKYCFEDSFITYRYADNLARGAGYVFSEDERIFGATSPLHVFLLAFLAWVGLPVVLAANIVFAAGYGAIAVLGGTILRHLRAPYAAVFFALAFVAGPSRLFWCWGLETSINISLALGVLLAFLKGRDILAAVLVGLAFLTRYDNALLAILLFAAMSVRNRRIPWKPGLIALAIVLPWLVFAQFYFGSFLPNTLSAKKGVFTPLVYLNSAGRGLMLSLWRPLMLSKLRNFKWLPADDYYTIAAGLLALAGLIRISWRRPSSLLLILYPVLLVGGYALLGPSPVFQWYLMPAGTCLLILIAAALGILPLGKLPVRLKFIGMGALIVAALIRTTFAHGVLSTQLVESKHYEGRVKSYTEIAEWIRKHDLQDDLLMTPEPGYLTFKSGNRVIDIAGLVTKKPDLKAPNGRPLTFQETVAYHDPDLLVISMPLRINGMVSCFNSYPHKFIQLSAATHREHYEELNREFREVHPPLEERTYAQHPFYWDIGKVKKKEWEDAGGKPAWMANRKGYLQIQGQRYDEPLFMLAEYRGGAESPPFLIDFDRLAFRFSGTDPVTTVAQLMINNRVVFEQGGDRLENVREPGRKFRKSSWPVGLFRGQVATLRFVNVESRPFHWLAFDRIESAHDEDAVILDSFDDLNGYSDLWEETFGEAPGDLDELAKDLGVQFAYSKGAATSLGLFGEQTMLSRPFKLERDRLHMLVYEYCAANGSAVQLLINGEVLREFLPEETRRIRPLTWNLHAYRGQMAQLRLIDGRVGPDYWLGVDEIVMSDQ